MENWNYIDQEARKWIREAGDRIRESLKQQLDISTKADKNDLVTNVDKETEQYLIGQINQTFPEHRILGEEGFGNVLNDEEGIIWVIDPIDGTMNFVHQQRNFMISVGIYENGIGRLGYIYDVIHNELYFGKKGKGAFLNNEPLAKLGEKGLEEAIVGINATWVTENRHLDSSTISQLVKNARGTRSYGSAALELVYVAAGWLDAYISPRLSPWDFAAGKIIIEELGGVVTNFSGESLSILQKGSVLAAKPGLHDVILKTYIKKQA